MLPMEWQLVGRHEEGGQSGKVKEAEASQGEEAAVAEERSKAAGKTDCGDGGARSSTCGRVGGQRFTDTGDDGTAVGRELGLPGHKTAAVVRVTGDDGAGNQGIGPAWADRDRNAGWWGNDCDGRIAVAEDVEKNFVATGLAPRSLLEMEVPAVVY
jgi:hypothetical protein